MGDFGAKGSVPGYNVLTALDYLLQFSSSWPLLKVHATNTASITWNATPQTIYTHNLGFPPFFFIVSGGKIVLSTGIGVDNSVLAYDGSSPGVGTFSFRYYVCRLDLTQAFSAPVILGASTLGAQSDDYGFKVTKPGKASTSTDLRDFALHSSTRSLMVHKVDPGTTSLSGGYYQRTVAHGLTYLPLAFAFVKYGTNTIGANANYYYMMNQPAGVSPSDYSFDATNVSMRIDSTYVSAAPVTTAVVLKDPYARETINLTFPTS